VINRKGATIVGVAIATALMPPLAVIGFGVATFNFVIAGGAFVLFMTNLLAIALSVTLISKWYGFGTQHSPRSTVWQGAVIILSFAALSVPLGISLRDIATRSWLERATRTEVASFLREHGARLSSISVMAATSGPLEVDLVALTPRYEPGAVPELKDRLQALLDREVTVTMQQLLVANRDERDVVRNLAQLEQSLAAMKVQQSTRDPATEFQNRLTTRLREQLGAVSLNTEKRTAIVYLAPDAGLSLVESRQLETRVAGIDPAWSVQITPPAQALPAIEFEPGSSALDEASIQDLETVDWALQRWNMAEVDVIGLASSDGQAARNFALAKERAEVVAAWLTDRSISSTVRPSFERRSQQPIERERGAAAFRRVEIVPVAGMKAAPLEPGRTANPAPR
jgi:outer membrane protein OmpA-like peptidoglycan-associated protein